MSCVHSAEQLVRVVHAVDNSLLLQPLDRRRRLAMTRAGGAVHGARLRGFRGRGQGRQETWLARGGCQFHRSDRAGYHTDKQFPITLVYDRFLRLIRRSFGFGAGAVILRATAKEFDRLVGLLAADAAKYGILAAEAEAKGWGSQVEDLAGEAGVAREKIMAIGSLTLRAARIGVTTPHLMEKLDGAWCHVAITGQRGLLSFMERCYSEPRGRGQEHAPARLA